MDPVSTLRSCIKLAKEIYDLKQNIDADDAACNSFFSRILSLNDPLEKLNNQPKQNMGSKKVSLDQINDCLSNIQSIVSARVKQKKSVFGFLKNARDTYTGSFKACLSDLNEELDRCIRTLHLCISVDSEEFFSNKLDEIAAALVEQSRNSTIETQFQREPYPEDFDDERSILGRGAFGVTHRMENTADKGIYAVKVIKIKEAEKNGIKADVLQREATLLKDLSHRYLVRYFTSYFSKSGTIFNLVMELVSGGSLDDKIKDTTVTVTSIRKWLVQMSDVLSYLHFEMRVLHRDIKPDNILLTSTSNIKVIDLGMACVYQSSLSKMSKVGTQTYSSYEKSHGMSYDGRDDVWAAGCVFAELLTKSTLSERGGSIYMHSSTEVNRRRQLLIQDCVERDPEMGSILSRMLESDVEKRITSQVLLQLAQPQPLTPTTASSPSSSPVPVVVAAPAAVYVEEPATTSAAPSTGISDDVAYPADRVSDDPDDNESSLDAPIVEKDSDVYNNITGISCGASGMQGWRHEMEDTHVVADIPGRKDHLFLAVFDGHGGVGSAKFAATNFLDILENTSEWREYVYGACENVCLLGDALIVAFLEVDEKLRAHQEAAFMKDTSGCTAVTCIITPQYIVCANAGDSRCVMGTCGVAKALSDDHKPYNEIEQRRIEGAGGFVQWNRVDGDLAVSRALGDFDHKNRPDLPPKDQKITCYPDITIHERTDVDDLVLLACDGLWDVMSTTEAVDLVRELFESGESDTVKIAEELLDVALDKGSKDNISAVCARLPGANVGQGGGVDARRQMRLYMQLIRS